TRSWWTSFHFRSRSRYSAPFPAAIFRNSTTTNLRSDWSCALPVEAIAKASVSAEANARIQMPLCSICIGLLLSVVPIEQAGPFRLGNNIESVEYIGDDSARLGVC